MAIITKQNITKLLSSDAGIAALSLRLPVGIILLAHGAQKLFGGFGGDGLEGTGQWMASIGLEPRLLMALLAVAAEFFGGLALILGLLARPAAVVAAFTMIIAIVSVHLENGLFLSNNGYEFGLALLAAAVSIVFAGAGSLSVDNFISSRLKTSV